MHFNCPSSMLRIGVQGHTVHTKRLQNMCISVCKKKGEYLDGINIYTMDTWSNQRWSNAVFAMVSFIPWSACKWWMLPSAVQNNWFIQLSCNMNTIYNNKQLFLLVTRENNNWEILLFYILNLFFTSSLDMMIYQKWK